MKQRYEHKFKSYVNSDKGMPVVRVMEDAGWELCGVDSDERIMYFKRPVGAVEFMCSCDRWMEPDKDEKRRRNYIFEGPPPAGYDSWLAWADEAELYL